MAFKAISDLLLSKMEVNIKIRNIKLFSGEDSPQNEILEQQIIKNPQTLREGWGLPAICSLFFAGMGIMLLNACRLNT